MLLVALCSLPFVYVLIRRPVLRRLALRNVVRRPRETVLVILGSLLGTAIMTGSFVVGDTFTSSIRRGAFEQLGPIDEVVSVAGIADGAALRARLAAFRNPDVNGVLPLTFASASIATVTTPRRAAPTSQLLETDFAAARQFGGDPNATGISGPTPQPGQTAIGTDLAHALNVGVGARIIAFAYGVSTPLRVVRVLPRLGVAGFWSGGAHTSDNAFVAPGTIAAILARGQPGLDAPPRSTVVISNRGGVEGGAKLSDTVSRALMARLGALKYDINQAKVTVLEQANRNGGQLAQIYSSLGTFGVLAGILLLVNIFFMLADERKSELGMLRAVGLRRSALVGAFATEGWCYALASSVAGTFAGLGLGRLIMAFAARLRDSGPTSSRLTLHFAFTWASVQRGLEIGFVIAIVTVLTTSVWLGRFNIIRAIRDINETAPHRPHARSFYAGLVVATAGLVLTGVGATGGSFVGLVTGPVFVFAGIGPALARNFPRRTVTSTLAAVVLLWGVVAVPIALALHSSVGVFLFVAQGLMLVGAAVVLVSQQQGTIGHAVGRLAKHSFQVRLGLAYPLARRFRTSMTLGMFALVVFILVYVSVIGSMFAGQLGQFTHDASGGFNVLISSNPSDPVPFAQLSREAGVRAVAPLVSLDLEVVHAPGLTQPREWSGTAFGPAFVQHGPPALDDHGTYATDRAAYAAVLANPHLAIVDKFFLSSGNGPPAQQIAIGDRFTVRDIVSGAERTFTIAALGTNDWANNGVLMSQSAARDAFGSAAVPSRAYVDATHPDQFVASFAGQFVTNGGSAETIRNTVHDQLSDQQQFFVLIRGYLALGLIVGVAGIGVIMVRAVRERRRQVGVLRALGVQAGAVRAAFVVESAFVAIEGLVIGTLLALVTAWSITLTDAFGSGLAFRVPVVAIASVIVGTLICALLATAAPARAASRIQPAVALRMTD
ncbi:MAG: ABC transporter permease [Acidimicrobiia bacterium]